MTEAPAPAEGTPLLDGAEAPASAPVDNKERERLAVEKAQETGPDGLSSETYAARFEEYGPNVLEEVKKNECLVFLSYFWGPMPIMIWVATLIVTLEKDYDDMAVLLTLQAVNGVVGVAKTYVQEITDATNRAAGFSVISGAWGCGNVIGPVVGGYLSQPCERAAAARASQTCACRIGTGCGSPRSPPP